MSSKSKIEWTERTWNPLAGCSKVSPGCENCYALAMSWRLQNAGLKKYQGLVRKMKSGKLQWTNQINFDFDILTAPVHWRKPSMIFVDSMSDLFHEKVPFAFIRSVFIIMQECNNHIFQVLTKRPDRMLEFIYSDSFPHVGGWNHPDNIWLGTSIEDQPTADKRLPFILQIPCAVRFISYEPALSEIDLSEVTVDAQLYDPLRGIGDINPGPRNKIDWIIAGGESGHHKRPCQLVWFRKLRDQCKAADVPFFMKQIDKIQAIPEDLQIRQLPKLYIKKNLHRYL